MSSGSAVQPTYACDGVTVFRSETFILNLTDFYPRLRRNFTFIVFSPLLQR